MACSSLLHLSVCYFSTFYTEFKQLWTMSVYVSNILLKRDDLPIVNKY